MRNAPGAGGKLTLNFYRIYVSFRQACMNFPEAVGIVGCPLNCGRRITDENQENNHFRQSL